MAASTPSVAAGPTRLPHSPHPTHLTHLTPLTHRIPLEHEQSRTGTSRTGSALFGRIPDKSSCIAGSRNLRSRPYLSAVQCGSFPRNPK
jgi:hypothetical protein